MNLFKRLFTWFSGSSSPEEATISPAIGARGPVRPTAPLKKGVRSFGLDAEDYLPISRQEIKQAAAGRNLLANAWFGRRDLIPPADDLRTQLVDRGMVTQSLITPEQLAEIHSVGAEMDRVRPTLASVEHQVAQAGEAAVASDREAQQRRKAQKKAEAAERKRQRDLAIGWRKTNDIDFLGRGVSGRLGDRTSRDDDLRQAGLPVLSTPSELARALGLSIPRLRWLAFHAEVATRMHYVTFTVRKKGGGERTLSAPHRTLALAQRWVFDHIVSKLTAEPAAHGFLPGRGILTNARPHAGRRVVVNLDLQGFFPSIGWSRVRKVFERAGYSPAVATILALLCTECPRRTVVLDGCIYHVATGRRGLPQGACTSPGLSNQVARRLDRRLTGLATKLGLTYTRYADDLTFSTGREEEPCVGYLLARVRHIAKDEGFTVNESKTRVQRRNTAQMVTGLVVNDRPGVRKKTVRQLRAILHRAQTEGLDRQNREGRSDFRAWLHGKIAFVKMARPDVGDRLLAALVALERNDTGS
jgi:RNA-directed DNA polymerase